MATQVIAQRGASAHAPGNTLAAFQRALDIGVDGIELDVQRTREGALVVRHGALLEESTNLSGYIVSYSLAELRAMNPDCGGGEKLITLPEALDFLRGKTRVYIDIEPNNPQSTVNTVMDAVRALRMTDQVTLVSLDMGHMIRAKQMDRRFQVGFAFERLWALQAVTFPGRPRSIDLLLPRADLVSEALLQEAWQHRWPVFAWTVNDPQEARRLRMLGVTGLLSQAPDAVADRARAS